MKKKRSNLGLFYLFGGKVDKEREEKDHEAVEKEAKKSRVACLLSRTCLIDPSNKIIVGNSLELPGKSPLRTIWLQLCPLKMEKSSL